MPSTGEIVNGLLRFVVVLGFALTEGNSRSQEEPFFRLEDDLEPQIVFDIASPFLKGEKPDFLPADQLYEKIGVRKSYPYGGTHIHLRDSSGRIWRYVNTPRRFDVYDSRTGEISVVPIQGTSKIEEVAPGVILTGERHGAAIFDAKSASWISGKYWPDGDEPEKGTVAEWSLLPENGVLAWPRSSTPRPGAGFIRWDGTKWQRLDTFHGFRPEQANHIRFLSDSRFVVFGPGGVSLRKIDGRQMELRGLETRKASTSRQSNVEFRTVPLFAPSSRDSHAVPFFSHRGIGEIREPGHIWWLLEFGDDMELRTQFYESLVGIPGYTNNERYPLRNRETHGCRWFVAGRSSYLFGYAPGRLRRIDLQIPARVLGVAANERLYLTSARGFFSIGTEAPRNEPPVKIARIPWPKRDSGQDYPSRQRGLRVDEEIWISSDGIPCRNLEYPTGHEWERGYMVQPADVFGRPSHRWINGEWHRDWSHQYRTIPELGDRDIDNGSRPEGTAAIMEAAMRNMALGKLDKLETDLVTNRKAILEHLRTPAESIERGRGELQRVSPSSLWLRIRSKTLHLSWIIDAKGCHKLEGLGDVSTTKVAGGLIWFRLKQHPRWLGFRPARTESESWKLVHQLEGILDYTKQFRYARDRDQEWWTVPQSGNFCDRTRARDPFVKLANFAQPDLGKLDSYRLPVQVDSEGWFYVIDKRRRVVEARRGHTVLELELGNTVPTANLASSRFYIVRSPTAEIVVLAYSDCLIFATPPDHASSPWQRIAVQIRGVDGPPIGFDREGNLWMAPDERQRCDFMVPAAEIERLAVE